MFRNADISSNHYVVLSRIVMSTTPYPAKSSMYVTFLIESGGFIDYDHAKAAGFVRLDRGERPEADRWEFELSSPGVALRGDIVVRFFVFDEIPDASVDLSSISAEFGPGARTVRYGNVIGNSLCFVSFHTGMPCSEPSNKIRLCKKYIHLEVIPPDSCNNMFFPHENILTLSLCSIS